MIDSRGDCYCKVCFSLNVVVWLWRRYCKIFFFLLPFFQLIVVLFALEYYYMSFIFMEFVFLQCSCLAQLFI